MIEIEEVATNDTEDCGYCGEVHTYTYKLTINGEYVAHFTDIFDLLEIGIQEKDGLKFIKAEDD